MIDKLLSLLGLVSVRELARWADFDSQLRHVTTTAAERHDLMQCALICGQAGMSSDQLPMVIAKGMGADYQRVRDLRWALGRDEAQIDRKITMIMNGVE